jgi:hypothetical protein
MRRFEDKERLQKRVISMRQKGYSIPRIAAALNISATQVHMMLSRSGLFFVKRKPGNTRRDSKIISMRSKGFTLAEIAEAVGTSRTTVHYVLSVLNHFPVSPGISQQTINRILALRQRGASLRQIGALVELNFGSVGRILREHRHPPRRD